ncbi:hypothetical protein [Eremococcus coleocola]|uniref:hypothetical protein n=1 Tax=Eremococcus coleocola TaxID=88132 RepID=UPI000411DB90|nr:hypothetical protein [Eremococcus coleocola]
MNLEQIATILGGFGVAFLAYLGTISNNKKDSTSTLINEYKVLNDSLKKEIERLKADNESMDQELDRLKEENIQLKLRLAQIDEDLEILKGSNKQI